MIATKGAHGISDLLIGCIPYPAGEVICCSFLSSEVAGYVISVLKDMRSLI